MRKYTYQDLDEILDNIYEQSFIAVTKDDDNLFDKIHRLDTEGLIYEKNQRHVYWLTKDGFKAIELGGFEKWQKHSESKQNLTSKSLNIFGNLSISDSKVNLFSDNSTITDSDAILNQLENMINMVKNNNDLDHHLKARLIDMNTELQNIIHISKESKLPILDNVVSLASNVLAIFSNFSA